MAQEKLELQAEGFHGHLLEISDFLVKENNAWLDPEGKGENSYLLFPDCFDG